MPKELYLYSGIYDFTAEALIASMAENEGEDITIRVNSGGGSVFAGWGIIAKMKEREGKTTVKLDGAAMSMAAFMLAFADKVEALDVSTIMLHRADMYVTTPEDQAFLNDVNKKLRSKLEQKIDLSKLPAKKAITMDQLFDPENRVDLFLTAKEAKAIGLVDKINQIDAKEMEAFKRLAASAGDFFTPQSNIQTQKPKIKMTIEQLKAEHPALFAEVLALGIAKEKDRVEACLAFIEVDAAGVKAAIESGKDLSQKQMADFALKAVSAGTLKAIEAGNANPVKTDETASKEKSEKEKELSAFEDSLRAELGLTKKS
jgi:ATP-dependent Clp protease protease subunit